MFGTRRKRAHVMEAARLLDGLMQSIDDSSVSGVGRDRVLQSLKDAVLVVADRLQSTGLPWPPYLPTGFKQILDANSVDTALTGFFSALTADEADALESMGLSFAAQKARLISVWRSSLYAAVAPVVGPQRAAEIVPLIHPWLASKNVADLEIGLSAQAASTWDVVRAWRAERPTECPGDLASKL